MPFMSESSVPTPGLAVERALSEHLMNVLVSSYIFICFSLYVQQANLRFSRFILRAKRLFLTQNYCDPICSLKTETGTIGPPDIFNPEVSDHQP